MPIGMKVQAGMHVQMPHAHGHEGVNEGCACMCRLMQDTCVHEIGAELPAAARTNEVVRVRVKTKSKEWAFKPF